MHHYERDPMHLFFSVQKVDTYTKYNSQTFSASCLYHENFFSLVAIEFRHHTVRRF